MDATVDQFQFMSAVPTVEPEEGSLAWAKQYVENYLKAFKENEGLFTQAQAARMLGITRPGVQDLVKRGQLETIEMEHGIFVTGKALNARLAGLRGKPGRPRLIDAADLGKSWK